MLIRLPGWLGGPVRVDRLATIGKHRYHDVLIDFQREPGVEGGSYYSWKAWLINSPQHGGYIARRRGASEAAYTVVCDEAYMWASGARGAGAVRFHHTASALRRLQEVETSPCDTAATIG